MEDGARRKRPGPVRWLLYAFGRGLPPEHREWVLHDLTTRTWAARQLFRSLVQVAPFGVLVALVIPGPLWVRLSAVLGGVLIGMIYAGAYLYEATEHRALKAGYPRGTLTAIREDANAEERAEARLRYARRYRHAEEPPPAE